MQKASARRKKNKEDQSESKLSKDARMFHDAKEAFEAVNGNQESNVFNFDFVDNSHQDGKNIS
jgi:hypothetical protein